MFISNVANTWSKVCGRPISVSLSLSLSPCNWNVEGIPVWRVKRDDSWLPLVLFSVFVVSSALFSTMYFFGDFCPFELRPTIKLSYFYDSQTANNCDAKQGNLLAMDFYCISFARLHTRQRIFVILSTWHFKAGKMIIQVERIDRVEDDRMNVKGENKELKNDYQSSWKNISMQIFLSWKGKQSLCSKS